MKKVSYLECLIFILIIILFLSFFQGYQCKYIKPLFCEISLIKNLFKENGSIENLQSILLFISILILFLVINKFKNNNFIKIFIYLKIVGLVYYLGEEISWGQHFFNWNTPYFFNQINNQNETNLHNTSNLLDQLPRTLVILWCGFVPIIFLFLKKKFFFKKEINLIFLPEKKIIVISIIFLIFFLPDFFIDKFNLHPGHHIEGKDIKEAIFFDLISFNFVERLSEIHELIFCFFFLIYCISFFKVKNFNQ